jgi:uncharacterized membrane protein
MPRDMNSSRLEAFSDGVIAVIITIMVLDLRVPSTHEATNSAAIRTDLRLIVVYLLSFVQTGIYWVNHHYLLDDVEQVTHGILWANLTLLFCLSLIPFGTQWIAVRGVEPIPVVVYVVCFLAPAVAWTVLSNTICTRTGVRPAASFGKQTFSLTMNLGAIAVAFLSPWSALGMIAIVALVWLVPPRRIIEQTRQRGPSAPSVDSR